MASQDEGTGYIMENENEIKRLSYNHEIFKHGMGGRLLFAPVDWNSGSKSVLDSATANGLWLRDLVCAIPGTHTLTGTDLNPAHFPSSTSSNFSYHVQDINKPWPSTWTSSFDLVHQRLVLSASPQPEAVVKAMADLVKPGGWIEFMEPKDLLADDAGPMAKMNATLFRDLFKGLGTYYGLPEQFADWLRESGFEEVQERVFECRLGAKQENEDLARKGVITDRLALEQLCSISKSFPPGVMSLSHEELDRLAVEGPEETEKIGRIMYMHAIWASKKA